MKSTKKRRCKRLAALVLALGVCVGAIPFTALADENKAIDEQDGVEVTRIYDEGDIVPYSAPQTGTLYTLYTSSFPGGSPGYTNTWETLTVTVSHVMKVNGVYKAAYCLDKELGYQSGAAHQSGNNLDDFRSDKKEIIGYILANGFQWNSSDYWSQSDNDKWLATQLLIWAVKGHASISEKTHLIGVDKSVRDDIVKISSKVYNPNAFVAYYDSLVSAIENARKIPSFCTYPKESFGSGTKTVTIPAQTDNEIEIPDGSTKKLNDTNKVLSKWSSALTKSGLISGLAVAVNGNTISLTSNNAKGSATVEYKPNGGSGALLAWQYSPDPTSYQRFATYEPNLASVKAKLTINTTGQPATGDGMKIVKFSEDDIVAGMQFAVSGSDGSYRTFSTNSNGEIDLSELPVYEEIPVTDDDGNPVLDETTGEPLTTRGDLITYTAKEISVPDRYVIPAEQTFTALSAGNVEFENRVKKFKLEFEKLDSETGSIAQGNATLVGAQYGIYKDGELLDVYTTNHQHKITTKYYPCGSGYTFKEIAPSTGYLLNDTVYKIDAAPSNFTAEYNTAGFGGSRAIEGISTLNDTVTQATSVAVDELAEETPSSFWDKLRSVFSSFGNSVKNFFSSSESSPNYGKTFNKIYNSIENVDVQYLYFPAEKLSDGVKYDMVMFTLIDGNDEPISMDDDTRIVVEITLADNERKFYGITDEQGNVTFAIPSGYDIQSNLTEVTAVGITIGNGKYWFPSWFEASEFGLNMLDGYNLVEWF